MFWCLLLFAFPSLDTNARKNAQGKEEALAAIPAALRAQFIERLKLKVRYQGARQWDKMYDLMPSSILQGISKEEFVKDQKRFDIDPRISTLISFTPTFTRLAGQTDDYGQWIVFGCAEYKDRGRTVHLKAGLSAELEKDKWFFSDIAITGHMGGSGEPCDSAAGKRRKH